KVQFTMLFRGREMAHRELGLAAFARIKEAFEELAKVERDAKMEGRRMTMVLVPDRTQSKTEGDVPVTSDGGGEDDVAPT
ncbi:MAG: translation initiation factor IF-3 C-terminal domain-containing protein, partial [Phycisphaeraceae bacterium]|nr:translation initiation factor IF-3 C-terminal domain-containing protein [Phycisphaeraceae bacterium]